MLTFVNHHSLTRDRIIIQIKTKFIDFIYYLPEAERYHLVFTLFYLINTTRVANLVKGVNSTPKRLLFTILFGIQNYVTQMILPKIK